jgi:hypothetical protein
MNFASEQLSGDAVPRCWACDDVIGVYEPLVEVYNGLSRQTSRAAEPGSRFSSGRCYHLACYRALEDEL